MKVLTSDCTQNMYKTNHMGLDQSSECWSYVGLHVKLMQVIQK